MLRARLTDKHYSKQHVAQLLGEGYVVPTLWSGTDLPVVAPWPMPFIVKANHGCGQFVVVRSVADYRRARADTPRWLTKIYVTWLDEAHYRHARRSLLVEPFIGGGASMPLDYKIYVFGGRASMVQVHEGRGFDHRWHQYDCAASPLSSGAPALAPRAGWAQMIGAAEQLGRGHGFLRVDFYLVDGMPLFGEFSLYPGSGFDRFDPPQLDDWLGERWSAAHGELPANETVGAKRANRPAPQRNS